MFRDTDTAGLPRTIVSSTGIDHTVQDMGKLKLGLRITPTLSASYSLGIWRNASQGRVDSYLRDASGATVFNASAAMANPLKFVRIDELDYTLSSAAPSSGSSEHRMHGFALHSTAGHAAPGSLDWELVASRYSQIEDISRSATPTNGYDSALGNPGGGVLPGGQITLADGTGWRNFDWRAVWRGTGLAEAHTVSAGLHVDRYELASITYGTAASPIADWTTSTTGALNTNSFGKTETRALYLQDEFRVTPDFTLTAGARHESWRAFDGSNFNAANTAPNPKTLVYANREFSHLSPKLQLAWTASPALTLRAGFGKAVRYPTVAEMFQTFNGPNNIRTNDPNLQPEQVLSQEWVAERQWETASLRGSLFYEDKRDALISQTDVTVTPNISSIQNVDRLRTHGLELAWQASHVANAMGLASPGTPKIDLQGSVTWTHSVIVANRRNPGLEGTAQPRIPDLRATVVGTWHATDATTLALSWRYSGRQHNALYNTSLKRYNDTNPDVYGAVSHYSVFDAKIRRRLDKHWSAAFGVNNLGNFKYYVNPNPYPQRTLFASLSYDL